MIHGRQRPIRAPHLQVLRTQHGERLRRGDFVNQMQVDVQNRGRVGSFRHDFVLFPNLLEERFGCHRC